MDICQPLTELAAFAHPREILHCPDLPTGRKRELLSAWACDAHTVPSRPAYRWPQGTPGPVLVTHILKALRALDGREQDCIPAFMIAGKMPGNSTSHA